MGEPRPRGSGTQTKKPLGSPCPWPAAAGLALTTAQELRADVRQRERPDIHVHQACTLHTVLNPANCKHSSPGRTMELIRRILVPNSNGEFWCNHEEDLARHAPRFRFGTSEEGCPCPDREIEAFFWQLTLTQVKPTCYLQSNAYINRDAARLEFLDSSRHRSPSPQPPASVSHRKDVVPRVARREARCRPRGGIRCHSHRHR